MEGEDSHVRVAKHPRWSPAPVDLSVATVPQTNALLASLGAAYVCSSTPTTAQSAYLNNTMVASPVSPRTILSSRKQREFIPDSKKDDCYWDRRKRNNEAAKRSREKRRISDIVLETRVLELTRENTILRAELCAIKEKFGLSQSQHFVDPDSIALSLPETTHRGRRGRLLSTIITNPSQSELNSNGSLTTYASSSSPTSSSSSEMTISPTSVNTSVIYSPPNIASMPTSTSQENVSTISPALHHFHQSNQSSLPFKLRHKAKNANNDSDSGSDTCLPNVTAINENNAISVDNNSCVQQQDSVLKSENYALRSELQRLASEVASLKNVIVTTPCSSVKPLMSSNNLRSNSYHYENGETIEKL